jgi:hypothetical protein
LKGGGGNRSCRDELAERAAGVVADERDAFQPERVHEVDDHLRERRRREIGIGRQRRLMRPEWPVGDDAAEVLRELRDDLSPQAPVDQHAVHEQERLARAVLPIADRSLRQMNLVLHERLLYIQSVRI